VISWFKLKNPKGKIMTNLAIVNDVRTARINTEFETSLVNSSSQAKFKSLMSSPEKTNDSGVLSKALSDGHLTDKEAIVHYLNGNGETAKVDASKLHIYQEKDFNSDNWAKGVVQGDDDFAVHGKVDMFKAQDGSITITSQEYDYGWEEKSGFLRNIATATRGALIGNGTEYMIEYYNSPLITRKGNGYTEKLFGN